MKGLVVIAIWCCSAHFLLAQTMVSGFTLALTEKGEYTPLPHVSVRAYREGPVGDPTESDDKGHFTLAIKEGVPFKVLFFATDDRIPELQQLAGVPTVNNVVVALLTVNQEKTLAEQRVVPKVVAKLECILGQIPENGQDPCYQAVRRILDKNR